MPWKEQKFNSQWRCEFLKSSFKSSRISIQILESVHDQINVNLHKLFT